MVDEDVVVSGEEIAAVDKELEKQDKVKETEIADKVRAEIKQEQKLKEMEAEKVELTKQLEEQKVAAETAKKEQEALMDSVVNKRLEEELKERKAVVPPTTDSIALEGKDKYTPEVLEEIERNSYEEFLKERNH